MDNSEVTNILDVILPQITETIRTTDGNDEADATPYQILFGKALTVMFSELTEVATPDLILDIDGELREEQTPDYRGMLNAIHLDPSLLPYLVHQLSLHVTTILDCSKEAAERVARLLETTATNMVVARLAARGAR